MNKLFRFLDMFYANLFGYFWMPCDNCGEYFGGHEVGFPWKGKLVNGHLHVVCPDCNVNPNFKDESQPIIVINVKENI